METNTINKDLILAIENENVVLFVGSGLSKNFGFPNWKELVMGILNENSVQDQKYEGLKMVLESGMFSEIEILDRIIEMNPNNKSKVYEFLVSCIDKDIQGLDFGLTKKLNRISAKIVTTNYDKILEFSLPNLRKISHNDTFHLSKLVDYKEYIFKLHGSIETPESCVLFTSDYESLYKSNHAAVERLKTLISDKTILFVGFSFNDRYVRDTFKYISEVYKNLNRTHYIITTENINFTEYGLEPLKLQNWDDLPRLLDKLGDYKKDNSPHIKPNKIETEKSEINSLNKVTNNKIALLFANPIDTDCYYNIENLLKYFKKYSIEIDFFHLTEDNIFDLEAYDYLFIFTEEIQNKIVIEDYYFRRKVVSLKQLENQISILNPKGIFIFLDRRGKGDQNPLNLLDSDKVNIPIALINYEENLNGILYKIFRKIDLEYINAESVYNSNKFSLLPINRGNAKINYQNNKAKLSNKIEKKNLINFIGRKTDITDIIRKTLDSEDKILTIKGSGGIGKTAIVKKIALELYDRCVYQDGISFIDCEFIKDYKTFERSIAKTFDLEDSINFMDYLRNNGEKLDALIILDNFEPLLYLEDMIKMKELITFISDYKKVIVTSREWIGFEFEEKHELRGFTSEEALNLFEKLYPVEISKKEKKILKEDILENLLNNNPLAIKIVIQNIPKSISMEALREELSSDFFRATNSGYADIYDNQVDENIERSTSLYQSIYYSYIRLSPREQLVFEILSLFPNGIQMEAFKDFFNTEEFRTDLYRTTNKELKSLENKSIIEINGGYITLQSIIGKFADFHLNKRTEEEKIKYYKRAFAFNLFVLRFLNEMYVKEDNVNALKIFDNVEQNFIKSLDYIDKVGFESIKQVQYIDSLVKFFHSIGQNEKFINKISRCSEIFSTLDGGELLLDLLKIHLSYYGDEFDEAYEYLVSVLPFEEIDNISNQYPDFIRAAITDYALNLYALEGYEYEVIKFKINNSFKKNDSLNSQLFKIGAFKLIEQIDNEKKVDFFYFELMLKKGTIDIEELELYIENGIYNKLYIELMQTNYVKTKMGLGNKEVIEKLVVTNPYTMGLRDLMLALCENSGANKFSLFESAIEKLFHIKYYYVEAIYYYCIYLKEVKHEDFKYWYDLGIGQSEKYKYNYHLFMFNSLLDEIKDPYNDDNYNTIDEIERLLLNNNKKSNKLAVIS